MNKPIIFSILLLFVFAASAFSQEARSIGISYTVNGKDKKIKNNSKVLFIQSGDTLISDICHNNIYLPKGIGTTESVDILFVFGKKKLFFASISTKKLLISQKVIWELGYYKKFNNNAKERFYQVKDFSKIRELYYWEFKPQEHGDGTITLVTVPKD